MKTTLQCPRVANVPVAKLQKTIGEAISSLFKDDVHCEMHNLENDETIIVMIASGVCATLHLQEITADAEKGVAV